MLIRILRSVISLVLLAVLFPPQLSSMAEEPYSPVFEDVPCWVDFPGHYPVDCGYLVVPAKRAEPQGATIKVAVAILHSMGRQRQPDPVVMIVGGPGSYNLQHIAAGGLGPMIKSWLRKRDVILVDQRGIGLSQPALACPEYDQLDLSDLSQEAGDALALETLKTCADTLTAQEIDLLAFNTVENADDLADLPVALGYDQMNYYGLSYGADVILEVIRRHPERVRSAILEGVSAPDRNVFPLFAASFEHALRQVIATCDEDSACRSAFPDLEAVTFTLLEQLNEAPVTLNVENPQTHEMVDVVLSADWFVSSLTDELFYPVNMKLFPAWVSMLAAQQYDALINSAQSQGNDAPPTDDEMDIGAYYSYYCSDNVLGLPQAEIDAALASLHPTFHDYFLTSISAIQQRCAVWPVQPAVKETFEPVASDVPVLMFSGRFDPVTPAYYADHVLETLPNGYHFVFPTMGHGVAASGNVCAAVMSGIFLDAPMTPPNAACIERERPIQFIIAG